VSGETGAAYNR